MLRGEVAALKLDKAGMQSDLEQVASLTHFSCMDLFPPHVGPWARSSGEVVSLSPICRGIFTRRAILIGWSASRLRASGASLRRLGWRQRRRPAAVPFLQLFSQTGPGRARPS